MRRANQKTRRNFKAVTMGLALAGIIGFAPLVRANAISDGNASATVGAGEITSWVVDGTDHLGSQGIQFFIRTGGSGPATPLGNFGDGNPDNFGVGEEQNFVGESRQLSVRLDVQALGGDPSKLPVNVKVSKTPQIGDSTAINLDVDLFALTDIDGGGTSPDASLSFGPDGRHVYQDGGYFGNSSYVFGEDGATVAWQGGTGAELAALLGGAEFADLSNSSSFSSGGDGAFALQWSFPLDAMAGIHDRTDDEFTVAIQNSIGTTGPTEVIPEPVTGLLGLMGLSALGTLVAGRRRNAK